MLKDQLSLVVQMTITEYQQDQKRQAGEDLGQRANTKDRVGRDLFLPVGPLAARSAELPPGSANSIRSS